MSARKTRLTEYQGVNTVYAAKITEVQPKEVPGIPGTCMKLVFGELGKQSTLIPDWCAENNPEAGGYFVVMDGEKGKTVASYMSADEFAASYTIKEA